jgi:hypothetical protein
VKVCVVHCPRFIKRIVVTPALTFACLESGIAQAQEPTAHESSAAVNDPHRRDQQEAARLLAPEPGTTTTCREHM